MESPVFAQIKESRAVVKVPVVELLRSDARNVILAAGMYLLIKDAIRMNKD